MADGSQGNMSVLQGRPLGQGQGLCGTRRTQEVPVMRRPGLQNQAGALDAKNHQINVHADRPRVVRLRWRPPQASVPHHQTPRCVIGPPCSVTSAQDDLPSPRPRLFEKTDRVSPVTTSHDRRFLHGRAGRQLDAAHPSGHIGNVDRHGCGDASHAGTWRGLDVSRLKNSAVEARCESLD